MTYTINQKSKYLFKKHKLAVASLCRAPFSVFTYITFSLFLFMEILTSPGQKEERTAGLKQHFSPPQSRQKEATLMNQERFPTEELMKLAAIALSLNVRLRSSDMPFDMQERAFRYARSFLDDSSISSAPKPRPNPTLLARALKKEFDSVYGVAWHCVVGKSFGSFVTHSPGGFMYFSIDSLFILLFKTEVKLVPELEPSSHSADSL